MASGKMKVESKDLSMLGRDILEWNIPAEVLAVLLKDRTTGRNLIWATDDYADRGKGFAAGWTSRSREAELRRNCDEDGIGTRRVQKIMI